MPRVYGIADADALGTYEIPEAVEAMATAGIKWIQIRAKRVGSAQLCTWIEEALRRLEGSGTSLWINDRVDLAALFPVAGIHLGQEDLSALEARKILGMGTWIGASTHDREQLRRAHEDPAVDLVAIGPVFPTRNKAKPDPALGLGVLPALRRLTDKPLVAIGGIDADNVRRVLEHGVDMVAVIGALCHGDIEGNGKRLLRAAEEAG